MILDGRNRRLFHPDQLSNVGLGQAAVEPSLTECLGKEICGSDAHDTCLLPVAFYGDIQTISFKGDNGKNIPAPGYAACFEPLGLKSLESLLQELQGLLVFVALHAFDVGEFPLHGWELVNAFHGKKRPVWDALLERQ